MPMYYPEWTTHMIEESVDATLDFCGEDLATDVHFGFFATVECEWSIYGGNDYPEPPSFRDFEITELTLYINGEEAFPGDTLYALCNNWALEQIRYYDYESDDVPMEGQDDE